MIDRTLGTFKLYLSAYPPFGLTRRPISRRTDNDPARGLCEGCTFVWDAFCSSAKISYLL